MPDDNPEIRLPHLLRCQKLELDQWMHEWKGVLNQWVGIGHCHGLVVAEELRRGR